MDKSKLKYHYKHQANRKIQLKIYDDALRQLKGEYKFCSQCNMPLADGATNKRCDKCERQHARKKKNFYEKCRALGLCVKCGAKAQKGSVCNECKQKRIENRMAIKEETIKAYGGKCVCCGETDLLFLTLDHVYNDGSQHRKKLMALGNTFYLKMRTLGYPKYGLQVLCWNCHYAKTYFGTCPHKATSWTSRQRNQPS